MTSRHAAPHGQAEPVKPINGSGPAGGGNFNAWAPTAVQHPVLPTPPAPPSPASAVPPTA